VLDLNEFEVWHHFSWDTVLQHNICRFKNLSKVYAEVIPLSAVE